jgi:hypothetical protein
MQEIVAKVIEDSIYPGGPRLTTMQCTAPRFILAEINTHRVFSRSSASSRAIPVEKQIQKIHDNPMLPVSWPREQKGMQGGDELDEFDREDAEGVWYRCRNMTLSVIEEYLARHPDKPTRLHKSVLNRLMEPYMWHTMVITSTAWDNFLKQRAHPAAQPEFRVLAEKMRDELSWSKPRELTLFDYHTPYLWEDERNEFTREKAVKISVARCARTSYLTQEGTHDPDADLALYERLVTFDPKHWAPLEHVASPWPNNQQRGPLWIQTEPRNKERVNVRHLPQVGNFLMWQQHRTTVEHQLGERTYV